MQNNINSIAPTYMYSVHVMCRNSAQGKKLSPASLVKSVYSVPWQQLTKAFVGKKNMFTSSVPRKINQYCINMYMYMYGDFYVAYVWGSVL